MSYKEDYLEEKQENSIMKLIIVILLLLVVFVAGRKLTFTKIQNNKPSQNSAQLSAEKQAQLEAAIIERVGKLMDLPAERPQVAVIADSTKITDPAFRTVKNGNIVLAYSNQTVVYSPQQNKVVLVGPTLVSPSNTPTETVSAVQVDVLNGTSVDGLAKEISAKITATAKGSITIGQISSSVTKNVEKTVIYRLDSAITDDQVKSIIPAGFSYTVRELADYPKTEKQTTSGLVVIVGADNSAL